MIYLQLYDSNTVLEKLPLSSTVSLLYILANVLEDDHPSALFIYFIEIFFLLQCPVDADLVECDPSTVRPHPHSLTLLPTT